jgi:hypothetical protein
MVLLRKKMMMMNETEPTRTSEEILEMTRQKIRYFESILGKSKELTPQQQEEFETKFHNAVRMKKWVE